MFIWNFFPILNLFLSNKIFMMNKYTTLIISILLIGSSLNSQIKFDDYFLNKQMRFDYNIAGNATHQSVFFEQIREEPYWGGSKTNLTDKFNFGDYRLSIFDLKSNILIYSTGYSDLFLEWQDTPEAKTLSRSFYSSVIFPYPKKNVRLEIDRREKNMEWSNIYKFNINPEDYFINTDLVPDYKVTKIYDSGDPSENIDIVIIPDGYTSKQMKKFKKDSQRFISAFFDQSPFKEYKGNFNFWLINAISDEKGTDIPGKDVWKKTILNTHFYTFDSERYLTTRDVRSIRDLAGCVPYDQIYILVNTNKYGGGGIYNFYNLCSSDHPLSESVFIHEFGHAFAALADEYAYTDDPPEERYDLTVEPFQTNITTLVDFDSKWKSMVDSTTVVPTPDTPENANIIGAFEGAGYVKRKIYRPMHDCRMRSNNTTEFCPVCKKALIEMMEYYIEH